MRTWKQKFSLIDNVIANGDTNSAVLIEIPENPSESDVTCAFVVDQSKCTLIKMKMLCHAIFVNRRGMKQCTRLVSYNLHAIVS